MDKSVAVKRLHKLLGKGFGYRVDPKAPKREDREMAKAELKAALAERDKARDHLEARRAELLQDQEYQTRLAAKKAAQERVDRLSYQTHHFPITVGVTNSMFFVVRAQGDNWQEVLDKVSK